jgi:ComF family protein
MQPPVSSETLEPGQPTGPASRASALAASWRTLFDFGKKGLTKGLAGSVRLALDVALPNQCAACRALVANAGVCASCWTKLVFIAPPYCPRLGIPFVYDPGPGILSMQAIANPPAFHRARAVVRYDEIARKLVHGLKYQDRTDLAPMMGSWMARAATDLLDDADLLVPVPLHWKRGLSRRYNQSGALARVIAQQSGVAVAHTVLKRVRSTAQQVGLSRSARALNVQGAFRVSPNAEIEIKGRRILLVDDVLTSGATADVCARTLLRAGAAQVDLVTFARVVAEAQTPIYSE